MEITGGSFSTLGSTSADVIGNAVNGTLTVSGGSFIGAGTAAGGTVVGLNSGGGTSTLTISGTGSATITTLQLSAATAIVNLDGGTLTVNKIIDVDNSGTTGNSNTTFNFNGGTLVAGASDTAFMTGLTQTYVKSLGAKIDTNGKDITVGQALLDSTTPSGGGLTKFGAGTLTLSGANTYTGATSITAGTLKFAKTASLYNGATGSWTATNIKVGSNATFALNVGGTDEFTTGNVTTLLGNLGGANGTSSNGFASGAILGFDTTNASGNTFTVADILANSTGSGGGALGVTKIGTNTLVLSGANTYTGVTTISAGTLSVSADNNLGNAPGAATAGSLVINGGTLSASTGFTLNSNRGIALGTTGSTGGTIDVVASQTLAYGGIVADNGGTNTLTKSGSGALTLSGANTFTGGVTLNAGTLNINNNTALGSSSGVLTINYDGAIFDNTSGGLVSISNNITSTNNTVFSGTNALTTSGNYKYENAKRTLTVNGSGTLTIGSLAVSTGGTNPLRKAGSGTLAITGASTAPGIEFGGPGGVVIAGDKASLGTGNLIVIGGGSGTLQSSAALTGANKIANGVTLGGALTLSGSNNFEIGGVITGAASLTKSGANTVTLSNANTYTGVTIIAGGTLSVATIGNGGVTSSNLGSASNAASNIVFDGGTLQYTGSTATSDRAFTINAGKTATIEVTTSGQSLSLAGATGTTTTGALTKTGAGTLTLTGASTYSGGTTVQAGTLKLSAASTNNISSSTKIIVGDSLANNGANLDVTGLTSSKLALTASQTLGGHGTVTGGVTAASGSHIAPGNSVGTLAVSSGLTLADGSIFDWEIDRTKTQTRGTGYDALNVTGTLTGLDGADTNTTYDAKFRIIIGDSDFSDGFWKNTMSWTDIFTESNGTTVKSDWVSIFGGGFEYYKTDGTQLATPDASTVGYFTFNGSNNNTLTWTAVPEPTSALAGLLITAGLLRRRRAVGSF